MRVNTSKKYEELILTPEQADNLFSGCLDGFSIVEDYPIEQLIPYSETRMIVINRRIDKKKFAGFYVKDILSSLNKPWRRQQLEFLALSPSKKKF